METLGHVRHVGHESPSVGELTLRVNRGKLMLGREAHNTRALA